MQLVHELITQPQRRPLRAVDHREHCAEGAVGHRDPEPAPRGAYCGAIGWAGPDGASAFNVAIRTLTLQPGGAVTLNVGGGVVADSTADGDWEEALWKARFARLT